MARKQRILVIDDDPGLVKMMGLILHRAGYEVNAASSGLDGLGKVESWSPDLIILDRMMPLLDGLEVARRLRTRPNTAQIPIIMLSAMGRVDDKVEGFEAGVDDYIAKPVESKELVARVRALLARAQFTRPPVARTVALIGAKGGVGTTSVALNVASAIVKRDQSVVLAELRANGGTLRYLLKIKTSQNLSAILALEPHQIRKPEVERCIHTHVTGLQLLLAPFNTNLHPMTPDHVDKIHDIISARASYILLELPDMVGEYARRTLELADQILLVTEPETLSVACAYTQLERLKEWGLFDRVNLIIVSRVPSAAELNRVEVENRLGMGGGEAHQASRWEARALEVDVRLRQGVASVIPSAPEMFHEAVRSGAPLVSIEPSAPAARALTDLANWLMDKDETEEAEPEEERVRYIK